MKGSRRRCGIAAVAALLVVLAATVVLLGWRAGDAASVRSDAAAEPLASYQPESRCPVPQGAQAQPPAPRMLYSVALYNLKQVMYTYHMLDAIRDICEAGYDVHVVLDVHDPIEDAEKRRMEKTMYCSRTRSTVPLEIVQCSECRLNLTTQHKHYMLREIDNYDLFVYSEDDMIMSVGNLRAYLQELENFKTHFPDDWLNFWPGFLRYENPVQCNNDKSIKSITDHQRIIWEHKAQEMKVLRFEGLGDYLYTGSPHQAMWVLTKEQLAHLQNKCNFLTSTKNHDNGGVRIWVSSFQHVTGCSQLRIIPTDRLHAFMIHHAPDKNFNRRAADQSFTFQQVEDMIEAKIHNGSFGHVSTLQQARRFIRTGKV